MLMYVECGELNGRPNVAHETVNPPERFQRNPP